MWYVVQVRGGGEENIVAQCRNIIGENGEEVSVLQSCFIPYTKRQRRYGGAWHTEQKILFPGYVFLISDRPEELFLELKRVPGFTKMLRTGEEIVPLDDDEVALLLRLGGEEQVVELSVGIVERDHVVITDGPLQGMEGFIKKIDRHKRTAWLEIRMMSRIVKTQVGLEVVEKR